MGQISLRGIRKSYGAAEIVKGIDLTVGEGEFMVFVGPSGCGKSTILRMIAGLEKIDQGELLIDGVRANDLHAAQRGAAMVFQNYALYPHMTVAENMGFALRMAGVARVRREEQVNQAADILRIGELLNRYPKELSGGQRQRVAIGRAIVRKPKVFLFDEPLSNLDAALRVTMRIELARLHKELGTTMIYVTHDQVEAMTLGHRIAVFNNGRIEQAGAPLELYNQPGNLFVAGFIGAPRINMIERPAAGSALPHQALWESLAAQSSAAAMHIGLRPEHLHLGSAAEGVSAKVVFTEHLGDSAIAHLRVEGVDDLLIAKTSYCAEGETVGLLPDGKRALPFDSNGKLLP